MSDRESLFGTDGIRGSAGVFPIDPESMVRLGHGIGRVLFGYTSHAQVIVGKDTRLSGYMLESALEAGLISSGVNVVLTGPLPTPAIGYLTETLRADLGIVISASHNPYKDNGIKLVLPNGEKLGKQACWEIEQYLYSQLKMDPMAAIGKASRLPGAAERYAERCKSRLIYTKDLQQMKIVIDCANGATYQIAKLVFQELHAQVVCINDKPDGKNINLNCGAVDTRMLAERVVAEQADCGLAFDGDGDRLMMVDHKGNELDGDDILWVLSNNYLRYRDMAGIVNTVMSNGALKDLLAEKKIETVTVGVGDQHVMRALKEHQFLVGAEPSGHILPLDACSMGDGIIAGILVLETMLVTGKRLNELSLPHRYQQVKGNIDLNFELDRSVLEKNIEFFSGQLDQSVRSVIRFSGTEPKLRYLFESDQVDLKHIEEQFKNSCLAG